MRDFEFRGDSESLNHVRACVVLSFKAFRSPRIICDGVRDFEFRDESFIFLRAYFIPFKNSTRRYMASDLTENAKSGDSRSTVTGRIYKRRTHARTDGRDPVFGV